MFGGGVCTDVGFGNGSFFTKQACEVVAPCTPLATGWVCEESGTGLLAPANQGNPNECIRNTDPNANSATTTFATVDDCQFENTPTSQEMRPCFSLYAANNPKRGDEVGARLELSDHPITGNPFVNDGDLQYGWFKLHAHQLPSNGPQPNIASVSTSLWEDDSYYPPTSSTVLGQNYCLLYTSPSPRD